ncbi:MAG: transcriptional repressor [Endomicrobiales bacterium]|nr:transcriptional repressor [Endomicrobiales bacterium]
MPKGFGGPPGWWARRFRGLEHRLTIPRQSVIDVLSKTSKHLSAEDIYLEVHKVYPMIGLSSVYRILEWLVQLGVVMKFDFGDKKARYELIKESREEHHHHHLVCRKCKRVIDYTEFINDEVEFIKKAEQGLSKKYNFKIEDHIIQFRGLCSECKETE